MPSHGRLRNPWWRHQMKTFSALLAICAGNSPVTGEFLAQRPVMRSFDVSFDLRLNKPESKQWWEWSFETPPRTLWRHCNDYFRHLRSTSAFYNGDMSAGLPLFAPIVSTFCIPGVYDEDEWRAIKYRGMQLMAIRNKSIALSVLNMI